MAQEKTKIVETFINGTTNNTYVPADEADALALCATLFGGNIQAYVPATGLTTFDALSTPVGYRRASIMLKNTTTEETTFLNLILALTSKDALIITALQGKTVNGVLADEVRVLSNYRTIV